MRINDVVWEAIFDKYDVLKTIELNGKFCISANQIKGFREPRLMTKFDHSINLPEVFSKNGLSILPVSRGDYEISSFKAYQKFEDFQGEIQRVSLPDYLQTMLPQYLVSEAIALNCANASGILNDFLEDENILPTVNGRMSTGKFDFNIDTLSGRKSVKVNNAQLEIDAAYEGVKFVSIFEAKRDLAEDFIIRQLYYPYRLWKNRVTKPIKTVFLVFSNGTFYLSQYQFENMQDYNSLKLVKQKRYTISQKIAISDLEDILKNTDVEEEPEIAFPQANSMLRIINLMELLFEKDMSKQDITNQYAFDERQTNYYTDACRYLGVVRKNRKCGNEIIFYLTDLGKKIMKLNYRDRQLAIVKQILKHRAFNAILKLHLQYGEMPPRNRVIEILKESNPYNIESDSTFERRSSTIIKWIEWILDLIEE